MIHPTDDYEFIKSVCLHPKIWPWVSDDYSNISEYEPDLNHLYLEIVDGEKVGFFAIKPINAILFEMHIAVLPVGWGKSDIYTKKLIEWVFSNTNCQKLIAFIPESNKKTLKLAEKCGLTREGFIQDSFQKNGKLFGQHLFSIARGFLCQLSQPQ